MRTIQLLDLPLVQNRILKPKVDVLNPQGVPSWTPSLQTEWRGVSGVSWPGHPSKLDEYAPLSREPKSRLEWA